MLEHHLNEDIFDSIEFPKDCRNFKEINFQSKSEAVCAIMLQKYLPNWNCELGATYQIPLAQKRFADFKINSQTIFEYHPISLHRDMIDDRSRREIEKNVKHLKQYFRDIIVTSIKNELLAQYIVRRKIIIKATPGLETAELIVAEDPRTFYRLILQRFAEEPPSLNIFNKDWTLLINRIN